MTKYFPPRACVTALRQLSLGWGPPYWPATSILRRRSLFQQQLLTASPLSKLNFNFPIDWPVPFGPLAVNWLLLACSINWAINRQLLSPDLEDKRHLVPSPLTPQPSPFFQAYCQFCWKRHVTERQCQSHSWILLPPAFNYLVLLHYPGRHRLYLR